MRRHDMLPPELSRVYPTFFPPLGHATRHASLLLTVANQKTFSVCSGERRELNAKETMVYPHAEAFPVVIADMRSYKIAFLKIGSLFDG
jgi:hypothetical protein